MAEAVLPKVLAVSPHSKGLAEISATLENGGYRVATVTSAKSMIEAVYADPPQCLIVESDGADAPSNALIKGLKSDNVYGHLPVILVITADELAQGIDWQDYPADDYLVRPFSEVDLLARVSLCLARAHREIDANPLTGLPGNLTIMREAERRIADGSPFVMACLDIDHFKAFNDKYGFTRGDEVLRMTARILVNAIRSLDSDDTHLGHVGGDDFVFMTPPDLIAPACQAVTRDFDRIVPNFYDEEDRRDGFIQTVDRRGNAQTFPLMTVSIAAVDTHTSRIAHVADLSARAAEVKRYAKQHAGSNFIVDRRK